MTDQEKQKLDELFESQNLSDDEKLFWFSRLEQMTSEARGRVRDLFEAFPGEIRWLAGIQIRKEKALASADHSEWDAILEEEAEHLGRLTTT